MSNARLGSHRWPLSALGGLAVIAATAMLAAAGGGAPTADSETAVEPVGIDEGEAQARVDAAAAAAPPEQQFAFESGSVSLDDYTAAVANTISCVESGLEEAADRLGIGGTTIVPSEPMISADGYAVTYTYQVSLPADAVLPVEAAEAQVTVEKDCQASYQAQVEDAYQAQFRADSDAVAAAEAQLLDCFVAAGFDVAGESARTASVTVMSNLNRDNTDAAEAAARCLSATPSVNNTGAPGADG